MEYVTNAVEKSHRDAKKQNDLRKLLQVQLEEMKDKERENKEDKEKPKGGEKLKKTLAQHAPAFKQNMLKTYQCQVSL